MPTPALISVDWGTTNLRCTLLAADGSIAARREGGPGIQPPPPSGFAAVLAHETADWTPGPRPLPILMSGMIGSRQGWIEAPYLPCPAGAADLAANLTRIDAGSLGVIHLVPGMATAPTGRPPEAMRGEETQIVGALTDQSPSSQGGERLFVLPGTHSKWVSTSAGAITAFATYMTGEIFSALRHHTILGRLMPEGTAPFHAVAFKKGVTAGAVEGHPGALLNRLFATRTLGLFDQLAAAALESYLSGILIGAELAAAASHQSFTIIGNAQLSQRYGRAAEILELDANVAAPDCAARGHWHIATAAGLVKEPHP